MHTPQDLSAISPGIEVIIEGLSKAPHFNGRHGFVQAFDEVTGRYDILLAGGPRSQGGQNWAKVKREHLRFAEPPPPCFAPTFEVESTQAQARQEKDTDNIALPEAFANFHKDLLNAFEAGRAQTLANEVSPMAPR